MSMVVRDWYVLCWCAKWLDKKKVLVGSLLDDKLYHPKYTNDFVLVGKIWDLLDEADLVIAHNAKSFDIKKINSRFLVHGFPPPSPYKVVDTLTVSRSYFKFTSNKLDDLGAKLKLGRKTPTGGIELWDGCYDGVKSSWNKMIKYCKQDVLLLEKLYLKFLPWITNHPNHNIYNKIKLNCPKCNSKKLTKNGFRMTMTGKKQRMQCQKCGGHILVEEKKVKKKNSIKIMNNAT